MRTDYDIVIIGGGMVGASLAAALIPAAKRLSLNIAVIERFPIASAETLNYSPSYDSRATALAYGSRLIYEQIGIWEELNQHLCPIADIHVSDKGRFGATRLNAEAERVAALGYVVENHWLGQVLLNRIQQEDAGMIELIAPSEVSDLRYSEGGGDETMQVVLQQDDQSRTLQAQLVVMADGGRSELREKMGIGYQQQSYQQHAVVTNISPDRPHNQVAYERFTDTGPMALLPLEDQAGQHRMGLVWTVPDEQIDAVMTLSDAEFMARIHERFGHRAGNFIRVGERHSYPLKLTLADEQVRKGLVVLGNAAHALHPIAGQGYNLALRGVVALAAELIQAREAGRNLGELTHLARFAEKMRGDQHKTIGFSDKTMKLFSNDHGLLGLGRSAGLQLLDSCPLAKTVFARSAMGLDLPTPDLN